MNATLRLGKRVYGVLLGSFLFFSSLALAQPIEDPGQDLLDERQAEEELDEAIEARPGIELIPSTRVPDVEDPFCFDFDAIVVDGVTKLSPRALATLVAENSTKCMGQVRIAKLMEAIQNRYTEMGYITTQVLIPEQDLSGGTLQLVVMEGVIESVSAGETDEFNIERRILVALPAEDGDVLNIRDLETMVDNISRPGSVKANIQLLPGQEQGGSAVFVTIEEDEEAKERYYVGISASGVEGQDPSPSLSFSGTYDNVWDFNDTLVLTASKAEQNESLSAAYTFTNKKFTHNLSLALSQYEVDLNDTTQMFGEALSASAFGERLLFRNAKRKVKATYSLDWSENRREIGVLELTPVISSSAKIGISETYTGEKGSWTFAMDVKRGTILWDAPRDPTTFCPNGYLGCSQTSLEAPVVSASMTRVDPILENGNLLYIWTLKGQHVDVPTAYPMGLGGWGSVRGFSGSQWNSDQGILLQNEWRVATPMPECWAEVEVDGEPVKVKRQEDGLPWTCNLSSYYSLDMGRGYSLALDRYESVIGASAGVSYAHEGWNLDVSIGTGLLSPQRDFEDVWVFKLSGGFSF